MTAWAVLVVYACVFMFRLRYGLLTGCEWDPVRLREEESIFIIKAVAVRCQGQRSPHEWQRGEAGEKHDLAPCFLFSLHPAHLIALHSRDHIKHASRGGRVRGHVISDITFLLRTYLYSRLPPHQFLYS